MAYTNFTLEISCAHALDTQDPLKQFKTRFYPLANQMIYMDGNSLGLASIDAQKALLDILEVWKDQGILIWNYKEGHYFKYGQYLGARVAKLIGAKENEVIITANTTLNIHQCIATLYKPTKSRFKIMIDQLNFPTDRYAVESQLINKGFDPQTHLKVIESQDALTLSTQYIVEQMSDDVALILLPSVLYRSAQLLDMQTITQIAHQKGIIIGWDLCHSIGSVDHDFQQIQPDFAVWCNYKYLSAGPGATAGVFINQKHFDKEIGLAGWFGNKDQTQFELRESFDQSFDIKAYQTGTPNLFSMAPLEGVLNIFEEASMVEIRKKSLHLTAYLMFLIDHKLTKFGFAYQNPTDDRHRGGHIALTHQEAYRICMALKDNGFIPDYREPNIIRLAPTALYNSYCDIYNLVVCLEKISLEKQYLNFSTTKTIVV